MSSRALLVRVSAASHAQLKSEASKHAAQLQKSPQDAASLCKQISQAPAGKMQWTVAGHDAASVIEQLTAGPPAETQFAAVQKGVDAGRNKLVMAFSGQGAALEGFWLEAYRTDPVFKAAMDRMAKFAEAEHKVELRKALSLDIAPGAKPNTVEMALQQTVIYAVQVALTESYAAAGITADAVMGHSFGEYAAAVAAGALSVEEGLSLVITRGSLMAKQPATGAMTAVMQGRADVEAVVKQNKLALATAGCNAPTITVLSGTATEVAKAEKAFGAKEVMFKRLETKHAFHSPEMKPMVEEFGQKAAEILQKGSAPGAGKEGLPTFISTVTAAVTTPSQLRDAAYWKQHVEATVNFVGAMQHIDAAYGTVLELGPQGALIPVVKRNMMGPKMPSIITASMAAPAQGKKMTNLSKAMGLVLSSPWGLALKDKHPSLSDPAPVASDSPAPAPAAPAPAAAKPEEKAPPPQPAAAAAKAPAAGSKPVAAASAGKGKPGAILLRFGAADYAALKAEAGKHAAELQKTKDAAGYCKQASQSPPGAVQWTVAGPDAASLIEQLNAPPAATHFTAVQKAVDAGRSKLLMQFSGLPDGKEMEGWWLEAYRTDTVFKAALDRICAHAEAEHKVELRKAMSLDVPAGTKASEIELALLQVAIYAMQVALTEAYAACSVVPDAVIGHSVGEYAAAVAAGGMSWEEGLALVVSRGAMMAKLPTNGAMTAVWQTKEEVEGVIGAKKIALTTACLNAQFVTVLSGPAEDITKGEFELMTVAITYKRLDHAKQAYHSPEMKPMVEEFGQKAAEILQKGSAPGAGKEGLPTFISSISAATVSAAELRDAAYWKQHVDAVVNYQAAMGKVDESFGTVVEVGSGASMISLAKRNMKGAKLPAVLTASLAAPKEGKKAIGLCQAMGMVLSSPWAVALKELHPAGAALQASSGN